ncbi:MAG: transposase, partial [Verrucomicrobia bacterium]|nr:transposase [Verrucomicrobiota bacterium]
QQLVRDTIRREEESFNKTLDRGIELFEREVARLLYLRSARDSRAVSGDSPETSAEIRYSKRRLPHFERPWAKYAVTFTTRERKALTPAERDVVLECVLFPHEHNQIELYAACVLPDHVHLLFEPQLKETNAAGETVFWPVSELLQKIKSVSAHRINQLRKASGSVWEKESFDRVIRSERDLQEKFQYVCRNPWKSGVVAPGEDYRWLWTPDRRTHAIRAPVAATRRGTEGNRGRVGNGREDGVIGGSPITSRESRALPGEERAHVISGEFAFRLYDEQGFPVDLTELMARERGLTVDVARFEQLMAEQRERARKAQKKQTISVEDGKLDIAPTKFLGYDSLETESVVQAVLSGRAPGEWNVVLDRTACYAEMGGQVGDRGVLHVLQDTALQILDTQKRGDVFVHRVSGRVGVSSVGSGVSPEESFVAGEVRKDGTPLPAGVTPILPENAGFAELQPGIAVRVAVDAERRAAIQRHHTVTHLLHWALHEVVSKNAVQKGSYVGPEKLTFDFSSAPLTREQVRDVETLVNKRIAENAPVWWTELPYTEVKQRPDIQQFFGDKYGEIVRVVQIGGRPRELNGYSMELCGGTHVRGTGDIGYFKIMSEGAIAAGVRRIEAVAGDEVMTWARREAARQDEKFTALRRKQADLPALSAFVGADAASAVAAIDRRTLQLKQREEQVHDREKQQAKAAEAELHSRAARVAGELAQGNEGAIVREIENADGALLQAVVEKLKMQRRVPIVLAGTTNGRVDLIASVPDSMTEKLRASDIVQQMALLLGGKGGGRPNNARGSGKDASRLPEALAKVRAILGV